MSKQDDYIDVIPLDNDRVTRNAYIKASIITLTLIGLVCEIIIGLVLRVMV